MEIRIVLLATLASVAVIETAVTRLVSNYRYPIIGTTTLPHYPVKPNQMMYPVPLALSNIQPGQDRPRRPASQPKAGPRPGSGQLQPQPNPNIRQRTQAMVTPGPKLDTTTQDRSIINAPSRTCPEGQRMDPDRRCTTVYKDPDNEG